MSDTQNLDQFVNDFNNLKNEIHKVIIGQDDVVNQVLISMFSNGHCLLVGVPGLAKTLLVNSIAKTLGLGFNRIQFTPDLMPSDIIGSEILDENRSFKFIKGPLFSNIILADEINRTPPKTQSALLEAMQERSVSAAGETRLLPSPFFVLATQNPIEQEGTYPLPEAQLDRFMFKLIVDYPSKDSERMILRKNTKPIKIDKLKNIASPSDIISAQEVISDIYVDEKVEDYVLNLVLATRSPQEYQLGDLEGIIDFGASPRATINLIRAAKARSFIENRGYVTPEDIRYIGEDVLRHRIVLSYEAEAEELTTKDVINRLFEVIEIP